MFEHFQLLVIGAGPGGYVAALKAAQLGARVAIVEKHHLGGACLNYGCIPSKALLSSAEMLHSVRHANKWGVKVDGEVGFDWGEITAHKSKIIRQLRGGIASLLKGRAVTHLAGNARFEAPGRVVITSADGVDQLATADKIIIATGSAPMRIPGWPDDPAIVCTSDEAVHWADLPKRLLIVGGGVIGCEFACMVQSFGVAVTIVELMQRILPTLDADLGAELLKVFCERGIVCHLDTKVEELRVDGAVISARLSSGETIEVDRVLVATGRRPNTGDVELDRAGIRTNRHRFVEVSDRLETNVAGHYAIGDANGRSMLAHAASAQGVAAAENALGKAKVFDAVIPSAVYTFPEVAAVGITEQEARDAGTPIAIGRFPIGHLGKAMASRHQEGFVKIIRHRETNALLGAHMIGHNATECIASVTALIQQKATMRDAVETVWAHPTISESIKEAADDSLGVGLHLPPRKVIRVAAAMAS
jgi:dihydrolipoamide dehydrogenase